MPKSKSLSAIFTNARSTQSVRQLKASREVCELTPKSKSPIFTNARSITESARQFKARREVCELMPKSKSLGLLASIFISSSSKTESARQFKATQNQVVGNQRKRVSSSGKKNSGALNHNCSLISVSDVAEMKRYYHTTQSFDDYDRGITHILRPLLNDVDSIESECIGDYVSGHVSEVSYINLGDHIHSGKLVTPEIIKGIISGLLFLERFGRKVDWIQPVVVGEKVGSVFFRPNENVKHIDWHAEMLHVTAHLGNNIDSVELQTLARCMKWADTFKRRMRLLKCPFFLSDDQKCHYFLTMMFIAAKDCLQFRSELNRSLVHRSDWFQGMEKEFKGLQDVERILKNPKIDYQELKSPFKSPGVQFIRALRNIVLHLCEERAYLGMKGHPELLIEAGKFLEKVEKVAPNWIMHMFQVSYETIEGTVIYGLDNEYVALYKRDNDLRERIARDELQRKIGRSKLQKTIATNQLGVTLWRKGSSRELHSGADEKAIEEALDAEKTEITKEKPDDHDTDDGQPDNEEGDVSAEDENLSGEEMGRRVTSRWAGENFRAEN